MSRVALPARRVRVVARKRHQSRESVIVNGIGFWPCVIDEDQGRSIFWIETVLAAVAATLGAVTALCPQWIERVFGFDPDCHSGSIEWNVAITCAFSAAFFAALAHRNWRKSLAAD
jgi:hypothetical protein